MTEVEFQKPAQALSSGCWSLDSNQYPSGRFPKVSIAIPVEKPKMGKNIHLSQEKPSEEQIKMEKPSEKQIKRLSQETTSERPPWISPQAVQRGNLNPNLSESLLGKRKETVQEGGAAGTSGLKLRLWEILGAGSQIKDETDSPRLGKEETAKKLSQNQNSIGKGKKGTIKLSQDHLEKVKPAKENPSSDPIETDSGSMKQADTRRVTRSLTRSRAAPQVTSNQDIGKGEPVKKTEAYVFSFDEIEPKERSRRNNKPAGGSSTSPKGTRPRKRAKIEPRKINFPKRPLFSGKESTATSLKDHISLPSKEKSVSNQREKTVSLNSEVSKRHFLKPKHNAGNSMRTPLPLHANQADKEKEHSWEFPVTPPTSNEEPQQKSIPNLRTDTNHKMSVECMRPAFVKPSTGFSAPRKEPVLRPPSSPPYNAEAQRKSFQSQSTDRNTNSLNNFKVPSSVKTGTGVSRLSRKPVQFLATPVTSNDTHSEKAVSTNRSFSTGFQHSSFVKSNIVTSTQRRKPIEKAMNPIISNKVQPEKVASASVQRNHAETPESPVISNDMRTERGIGAARSISGDFEVNASTVKLNVGAATQNIRLQSMATPVTANDAQAKKNTRAGSRSRDFNAHSFTHRKQLESPVSPVPSNEVQPVKDGDSPLHGDINMSDYFKSPTFAMNGTGSSQRRKDSEEAMNQPRNPKTPECSTTVSNSGSDSDLQLSDDSRDSPNMSEAKSSEVEVEREAEKSYHPTSEEVLKTENSDEKCFFKKGYRRTDKFFSSPDIPIEQSLSVKSKTKARAVKTEVKRTTLELSPSTPDGCSGEESNGSEDILNQIPDNSLASAVCQLATVLRKLKSKIETQKNTKSSGILSTVAEKIEKQLKDAELQLQEDTRKLIVSSKTKKKEVESNFQEQAQKLKVIHDKFRAEIDQYLMDCKSSLDEYDAFHMELKGTADKQKAQHRKLVRRVEKEIEAQLTDAETTITRVQKEAEKKMNGLKRALREWVAEGAT